jgi:kynurenine formamidase
VPKLTPDLLSLVKTGTVYSLAVVYQEGMPKPGPMLSYNLNPRLRHSDARQPSPASVAAEVISMSTHVGTHIDALCHIGERQNAQGEADPNGTPRLYNGPGETVAADEHVTYQGQTHLSIAEMPPIICRAVLLDVAAYKGVDVLPDSYVVTADDIAGTLAAQSTEIQPGTAVLIRTGFYQHLRDGNPAFTNAVAGPGLEAAKLLVEQGMILAGADNMSVEANPPSDQTVHRFHLVHHGITHLEVLYLEALAAQQVYEFLLIVTPLRLLGSTGSWVHPIAIA